MEQRSSTSIQSTFNAGPYSQTIQTTPEEIAGMIKHIADNPQTQGRVLDILKREHILSHLFVSRLLEYEVRGSQEIDTPSIPWLIDFACGPEDSFGPTMWLTKSKKQVVAYVLLRKLIQQGMLYIKAGGQTIKVQ